MNLMKKYCPLSVQMFVDALQAEMHKKYDLRPRQKVVNQQDSHNLRILAQVFLWIKSKN
jgi:hypothetical protein